MDFKRTLNLGAVTSHATAASGGGGVLAGHAKLQCKAAGVAVQQQYTLCKSVRPQAAVHLCSHFVCFYWYG